MTMLDPTKLPADPLAEPWLVVCGKADLELARALTTRVKQRVQSGSFSWEDVRNIAAIPARLVSGDIHISTKRLELLRRMCQSWDIELRPREISSHRPFIGPLIVACKRVLLRMVQVLFKDLLQQQRDFNALAVTVLAGLANEQASMKAPHADHSGHLD